MTFLFWVKVIVAVATMAFGAMSIVSPSAAERFTGLTADGPRGVSEIRAVLGGLFLGLGLAALIYRSSAAFGTVGIGYLLIGVVRAASIYFDRAPTPTNWVSLAAEVVFGILLLI
jgi:hypothetical protein